MDPARARAVEGMALAVESALAARDVEGALSRFDDSDQEQVRRWMQAVVAAAEAPIELQVTPRYPMGQEVVASVRLFCAELSDGGYASFGMGERTLREVGGRWTVGGTPDPAGWVMTALTGDVWLQPDSEWLAADVTLTVEGAGSVVPVRLAARRPGDSGWLRLRGVEQDGEPVPFLVRAGSVVVQPRPTDGPVNLRMTYEGQSTHQDWGYVRGWDVLLRGADTNWLPTLPHTSAAFDVTVHTPPDFTVFGQGEMVRSTPGITRFRTEPSVGFTLYGAPAYTVSEHTWGDTRVEVALWPNLAKHMAATEGVLSAVEEALAPLGPYPQPHLRVVSSGFNDGRSGYGAVSNIAVGWRTVNAEPKASFYAHEMSHGWFGGLIPLDHSALARGQWNESLAEYVSGWVVEGKEGVAFRRRWLSAVSKLPRSKERAMTLTGTTSADHEVHHAVTYARGALLLTAVEDRIGRERMVVFLRGLAEARAGLPTTWEHVVDALAAVDAEAAAWVDRWIATKALPELQLDGVAWRRARVSGDITQTGAELAGQVMLVWLDEQGARLGQTLVPFEGERTSFDLEVPPSAKKLRLDPDARFPRRQTTTSIIGSTRVAPVVP